MTTTPKHDTLQTMRLLIKGRVQGVGYRAWCVDAARRLGVLGWVRNRSDGSVEALVYGPAPEVNALIEACKTGPGLARVTAVNAEEMDEFEETPEGFQQRPTHGL